MKKIKATCCLFLLFLVSFTARAQFQAFSAADSARNEGDIKKMIAEWKKNYDINPKARLCAFFLAQAYAIDRQADSAFKYLFIHLDLDSSALAASDDSFLWLRADKRWKEFEDKIIRYVGIHSPGALKDIELTKKLWEMTAIDQQYYLEIQVADHKIGMNNPVSKALWEVKEKNNARNAAVLDSIINKKGWPKISQVGRIGASAAFLVVQHSDLERQKKYIPVIKKLCQEKEAEWDNYALMYDRIQMRENKPQLYGSQLKYNEKTGKYEFYPIEDEKNVDKRRAEMGMGTLAEYAQMFGITYEPK